MNWAEVFQKVSESVFGWAFVGILGGLGWLVRMVFTNHKQIELLQHELRSREEMRERDRQDLQDVKTDVRELRDRLLTK